MKAIRILLKIIVLPLILIIGILHVLFRALANLSCYIIGPLMLFIFGCGVYTVIKQLWSQTFLLGLMEAACFLVLFGASFVIVLLESWSHHLAAFLHS